MKAERLEELVEVFVKETQQAYEMGLAGIEGRLSPETARGLVPDVYVEELVYQSEYSWNAGLENQKGPLTPSLARIVLNRIRAVLAGTAGCCVCGSPQVPEKGFCPYCGN